MSSDDSDEAAPLATRLNAARDRGFIGRTAELARFQATLTGRPPAAGRPDPGSVLFLHGPGGVGKSMLLRRFATLGRAAGRRVVEIDGRAMDQPTPALFEAEANAVLTVPGAVLLVDTFERCQGLQGWLRERFLPRLPSTALVVLAGRQAPDLEWRSDPGWAPLLGVEALANFPPEDAITLLAARGVPETLHPVLLAFTGGHPLALSLASEVAADPADTHSWSPTPDVVQLLLSRLVGHLPSSEHRYALEVCAHAQATTEDLLRAAGVADPAGTFEWLRGLPYVESGRHGLFPHDVVRDSLDADLRWRDPQGYESMHRRVRDHMLARARAAHGVGVLPAMAALNYLRRYGGVMPHLWVTGREGELYEDRYQPEDREALLDLAASSQRVFSAELVRFWLERQPESFSVHRRSDTGAVVGYVGWLKLTAPDDAEIATDPVVAAAWAHARTHGRPRPGEHLAVARFMITAPEYRAPSPAQALMMQRILANFWRSQNLAWSFLVTGKPPYWEPLMNYIDHALVPAAGFGLFAHDWRAVPMEAWLDRLEAWELFGLEPRPATEGEEFTVLTPDEFEAAVRDALRTRRHRDLLAANPLIRSRVVRQYRGTTDAGPDRDDVTALQQLLTATVNDLRHDPRDRKLYQVLDATYSPRLPTQEAAAAELHLSLSTYRRHLKRALQRVFQQLWYQEMHGTAHPDDRARVTSTA